MVDRHEFIGALVGGKLLDENHNCRKCGKFSPCHYVFDSAGSSFISSSIFVSISYHSFMLMYIVVHLAHKNTKGNW